MNGPNQRSCTEPFAFAPDVIDGYPKPMVIPAIPIWLVVWICLVLIIVLTGLAAGYLS